MRKIKNLLILLLLFFLIVPGAYCYSGNFTNNGGNEITININDDLLSNYYCYIIEITNVASGDFKKGDYVFFFSESPIITNYNNYYYKLSTSDSKDVYYYKTTLNEGILDFSNVNLENSTIFSGNQRIYLTYIFSNFDIYNTDNELVFEKNYVQEEEPLPPEEPEEEETEITILKSIDLGLKNIFFLLTIIFIQTFLNNCFKRRE